MGDFVVGLVELGPYLRVDVHAGQTRARTHNGGD